MHVLTQDDGEIMVDHRGSPGITAEHARSIGMDGVAMGEGTYVHAPTLGCVHCGSVQLVNPNRMRERPYCRTCDHYICDVCDPIRREADYVHRTIADVIEAVKSGKYLLEGSTHRPVLIPIGALNGR